MIPFELKSDKEGLLYSDDDKDLIKRYLYIDKRQDKHEFYASNFYRLLSSDEYIVKRPVTLLNKKTREEYKHMLVTLLTKQPNVLKTDFPIGYYREKKKMEGLIVRYYKDGISLDNIVKDPDINLLGKYYAHDEDNIRNLFLLLEEVLDNIYEMFENEIYYTDINSGNIVIDNNMVKLIDFDPDWLKFDNKDKMLIRIMNTYVYFIKCLLHKYDLNNDISESVLCFEEAKRYVKKVENRVRINK